MNKLIKIILIFLVIAFLAIYFLQLYANNTAQHKNSKNITITPQITATVPQRLTLEGEITCLPLKDKTGPATLECAMGLMTDDGNYYALDLNLMSQDPMPYDTAKRIRANGIMTPIEMLSTDYWRKYDLKGIFSVTDSLEVLD